MELTRPTELLATIVAWARAETTLQAAILTGSLARKDGSADELSDIDIELFFEDHEPYANDDAWMSRIAGVWMYLPLPGRAGYPNRLVLFEGGSKVDFSLRPVALLREMASGKALSDLYDRGYRVLFDKSGLTASLPPPTYRGHGRAAPTPESFTALVEEFFFEAHHVAKYLRRNDLWTAKLRDFATKELLRRMIELYERALHGADYDTEHLGHNMQRWAEPEVWAEVQRAFSGLDVEESWRALEVTMRLFSSVARDAAGKLGFSYPEQLDDNVTEYCRRLRSGD